MNSMYDYTQLSTKYSLREMESYENVATINRQTNKSSFEDSTTTDFNGSNNQFDCLINEVEGVNVDTIANENKSEEDVISMASRYEHYLTNDHSINKHHHHHVMQSQTENSQVLQNSYNSSNINANAINYSYLTDIKNGKITNDFLNTTNRFQYILMAPTSPAVKSNEDTLTYLNQGQNYELRLNRFANTTTNEHSLGSHNQPNYAYSNNTNEDIKPLIINGKLSPSNTSTDKLRNTYTSNNNQIDSHSSNNTVIYLSLIRLCFWDRKLQEVELDEIREWEKEYNNIRMLEIDNNSSYGVIEVRLSDLYTNAAEVFWNGKTGANIFFRCNCTSTAFAPHKHGGEKGIHMRLQIDTYEISNTSYHQNGIGTSLTINTNDYNTSSILSPPNSSSSPVSNKFLKDDLEFNSSDYQQTQKNFANLSSTSIGGGNNHLNNWKHVCSSYSRIQLFRLKGAQRKLKTDRSKIERLNPPDLRKRYQASSKITLLYNCAYDPLYSLPPFNRSQEASLMTMNHTNNNNIMNTTSNNSTIENSLPNEQANNCVDYTNQLYLNSAMGGFSNNSILPGSTNRTSILNTNYNLQPIIISQLNHLGPHQQHHIANTNSEYLTNMQYQHSDSLGVLDVEQQHARNHGYYYEQNLSQSSFNNQHLLTNKTILPLKESPTESINSNEIVNNAYNGDEQIHRNNNQKRKSSISNSTNLLSNIYSSMCSTGNQNSYGSKNKMQKINPCSNNDNTAVSSNANMNYGPSSLASKSSTSSISSPSSPLSPTNTSIQTSPSTTSTTTTPAASSNTGFSNNNNNLSFAGDPTQLCGGQSIIPLSSSSTTASYLHQVALVNSTYHQPQQSNSAVASSVAVSINYPLSHDRNSKYVQEWLINNRFFHLLQLFSNYTSNDFLRLSKEDMINLCGAPDGIRCYNMAHNIQIKPKLTIFITFQNQTYFSAIFLADWKSKFLINKIFNHFSLFLTSLSPDNNNEKNFKPNANLNDVEGEERSKLSEAEKIAKNTDESENSNKLDEQSKTSNNSIKSSQIESSQTESSNNKSTTLTTKHESYVIDESHFRFYDLMKNSNFEYELFLKVKDILVKTTDEVLNNFQDQSRFMIEFEFPVPPNHQQSSSSSSQPINNNSNLNSKVSYKSDIIENNPTSNVNQNSKIPASKINNTVKIIMIPLD